LCISHFYIKSIMLHISFSDLFHSILS
jgi:hypothetical protein